MIYTASSFHIPFLHFLQVMYSLISEASPCTGRTSTHWKVFRSHPGPHLSHHLPPPKRSNSSPDARRLSCCALVGHRLLFDTPAGTDGTLKILAADTSSIVDMLICKACSIGVERNGPKKLRKLLENPTASHVFFWQNAVLIFFSISWKAPKKSRLTPNHTGKSIQSATHMPYIKKAVLIFTPKVQTN